MQRNTIHKSLLSRVVVFKGATDVQSLAGVCLHHFHGDNSANMGLKLGADSHSSTTCSFLHFIRLVLYVIIAKCVAVCEIAKIGGIVVAAGAIGWYLGHKGVFANCCSDMKVNIRGIQKDQAKVVHTVNVEDLPEKGKSFCRCWRSKDVSCRCN